MLSSLRSLAYRGGSRILQGQVSNPSERGTEVERRRRQGGLGRGLCPIPRKFLYFLY